MKKGPLADVRVVEWGNFVSAPFCGKVMAELGADVIKVESLASGDDSRRHGPFPDSGADPERSGLFMLLNINKRGISLDLHSVAGQDVFGNLLETADIFLDNQPPGLLRDCGATHDALKSRYPGLVVTSISPYGRTGPYSEYKGCDLTVNALGGLSFGTGFPHREPLTTPLYQASFLAGVGAAFASVAALIARDLTGQGQLVDVAEAQVVATLLTGYHLPTYIYKGIAGWRAGNRMRLGLFPNCVLPCLDGYICIDAPQLEQYQRFLSLLGEQSWTKDLRYRNRRAMSDQYPEEAEALITPWFMEHTKDEILQLCLENRVPCVPVHTFDEVLNDPQLNARDYFLDIEHSEGSRLRHPGSPYRFSATTCRYIRPAPKLGQHNKEILCDELGLDKSVLSTLTQEGSG